jgi:hypothetical protein
MFSLCVQKSSVRSPLENEPVITLPSWLPWYSVRAEGGQSYSNNPAGTSGTEGNGCHLKRLNRPAKRPAELISLQAVVLGGQESSCTLNLKNRATRI